MLLANDTAIKNNILDRMKNTDFLKIGLAQIAPVWLDKTKTLAKIMEFMLMAAHEKCDLVVFGEALLPGYPFWIEHTNGASFNSPLQKHIFSHYISQSVCIEAGDLKQVCEIAAQNKLSVYLGCIEKPVERGGHSLYCSLVFINGEGKIRSVHRKLMPTYDERLVWSIGDGNGLTCHKMGSFTVGGLNCWENWMPLPRAALHAQGEDLHVAVWPGSYRNTHDITLFMARESRSFVVSVGALMKKTNVPHILPFYNEIIDYLPGEMTDGGSCMAGPDGKWILEPIVGEEGLFTQIIDHDQVRQERQNFDLSGHYSRPDVLQLHLNCSRQSPLTLIDSCK